MWSMRAVAYYPVSAQRQRQSGLGLDAQREAVRPYLAGKGWPPKAECTKVGSGRKNDLPQLAVALEVCRRLYRAQLVIAKLDRLARNAFLPSLRDAGVELIACDLLRRIGSPSGSWPWSPSTRQK
jgi:DNA invertase Pin-like site-specific DNA recombinase